MNISEIKEKMNTKLPNDELAIHAITKHGDIFVGWLEFPDGETYDETIVYHSDKGMFEKMHFTTALLTYGEPEETY